MYDARFGRWLSPDPYGQFWSSYVGMGNIPNMGVDPDGGYLSMFGWKGALIGAAVGAGVGLAFDKDNWGWYALGGALAGGFLSSDFAKVEIWGTHRGLGNADALYGGGRENIARINHMELKYTGKLFTGENIAKGVPPAVKTVTQVVTQTNTTPVTQPPASKSGPPGTDGVSLHDGDPRRLRPSPPGIKSGQDVLQSIADHLKENGGKVEVTNINTGFDKEYIGIQQETISEGDRVQGTRSSTFIALDMEKQMYKRLLFVHNTLIKMGAPRGSVITTRTRFNYGRGNSNVGFRFVK